MGGAQDSTFTLLKEKLCYAHVLALPDLTNVFEIKYDVFEIKNYVISLVLE
jgi:hypothetical protein